MELIYAEEKYQVFLEEEPTVEMFDLLKNTNWGTGKTVYQHFNNEEHLLHIADPQIFTVREEGALRAFTVFIRRRLPSLHAEGHAYYIRFFCASPEIKGAGIVKNLSEIVIRYVRRRESPACFYATIEARNPAVRKVVTRIGFDPVATLKTIGFSRFFPRQKLGLRKLEGEEWNRFLPVLNQHKAEVAFWTSDNLQLPPGYFVHERNGEILLGAQVHFAHWAIHKLPGIPGIFLPLIPYLPFIRKIANPKALHFLTLEGIYVKPGAEALVPDFLESLLHRFSYHSLMCWADARDPLYDTLSRAKPGLLHEFVKNSDASFVASFNGYTEEQVSRIKAQYFYVSSYDNI